MINMNKMILQQNPVIYVDHVTWLMIMLHLSARLFSATESAGILLKQMKSYESWKITNA